MKIKSIETFPVKLKFKEPFVISNVVNDDMFYVIVKVTMDNGLIGYGEAIPAWEVTGETQFGVIDVINHLLDEKRTGLNLIGHDVDSLDDVKNLMEIISKSVWGAPSAKAALEQSLLDAYGKFVEKPLYELFGGLNEKVESNGVIGIYPIEETLNRVEEMALKGVKVIKLKGGIRSEGDDPFIRDIAVVRNSREIINRINPSIKLALDANQGYHCASDAVKVIKRMEGFLDWIEQPIIADDKLGFKTIKNICNVKLMADESVHNYNDAKLLLELKAVDLINVKLMKTGGIFEALRIAELAEKYGVPCQIGSMLESQLGISMGIHAFLSHRNFVSAELSSFSRLQKSLGDGVEKDEILISVTDTPGCGVVVREDEIHNYLVLNKKVEDGLEAEK